MEDESVAAKWNGCIGIALTENEEFASDLSFDVVQGSPYHDTFERVYSVSILCTYRNLGATSRTEFGEAESASRFQRMHTPLPCPCRRNSGGGISLTNTSQDKERPEEAVENVRASATPRFRVWVGYSTHFARSSSNRSCSSHRDRMAS